MQFEKTIIINSLPSLVWKVLTDPTLMKQWMGEPEMNLNIQTDWTVNSPIVIFGFHHVKFENKGVVLEFEPNMKLTYTHLSSISRLADKPENYTIFEFTLTPLGDGTSLTLTISNFPTESIFKHNDFYWRATMEIIKKLVENNFK
ncbi:MAG: SRPBCC domain-containing protein [Ignavibacteriae bacterium]|nr:SRPBCC domain-containing protein [Ignavibacteriota bacterium]